MSTTGNSSRGRITVHWVARAAEKPAPNPPSPGSVFGWRLSKVQLAVLELMAQEMDIAGGVPKSIGDDVSR